MLEVAVTDIFVKKQFEDVKTEMFIGEKSPESAAVLDL